MFLGENSENQSNLIEKDYYLVRISDVYGDSNKFIFKNYKLVERHKFENINYSLFRDLSGIIIDWIDDLDGNLVYGKENYESKRSFLRELTTADFKNGLVCWMSPFHGCGLPHARLIEIVDPQKQKEKLIEEINKITEDHKNQYSKLKNSNYGIIIGLANEYHNEIFDSWNWNYEEYTDYAESNFPLDENAKKRIEYIINSYDLSLNAVTDSNCRNLSRDHYIFQKIMDTLTKNKMTAIRFKIKNLGGFCPSWGDTTHYSILINTYNSLLKYKLKHLEEELKEISKYINEVQNG